jgi:phage baseplate assembly protein W
MKYRDLNIFFARNPDNNDISFVSGNSSIIQSIKNIVLTKKGERFFNNHFGTDILNLLFDNPSPAALQFLQKDIETILGEIEPRIIVDSVEIVYPDDDLTNDIRININFFMNKELNLSSDTKQTIVLTVGAS